MKSKKIPPLDLEEIMPLLIGVWRRFRKESGPADVLQTREFRSVVEGVEQLRQGLENDKTLIGQDYFSKKELLGAYLLYFWVVHYQQGISLINEIPRTPRRVLDICSGPAPFAFAALRHGASEVIALDRNLTALELGAEIAGRYGLPLSLRKWIGPDTTIPETGSFDLIILGHCLEELFPATSPNAESKQRNFVKGLLNRLSPNGHLLIVESSLQSVNQRMLRMRDELVADGVPVQAPCVWRGGCPALQTANSPCYAQREFEKPYLIKEIQRAASINLGSLKMTYLIFRSPKAGWPELPEKKLYRIISPPVESQQGTRYYLCGTDGKKNLGSHLTQYPTESKAFDFLRRGELISIEGALEKPHSLDVIKGTRLSVEAACGKPLPEEESDGEDY